MITGWALKWRSENWVDGKREYIMSAPSHYENGTLLCVFRTRDEARRYQENWQYITHRPDLRREPHGWRTPQVVKVQIHVTEVSDD